MINIRRYQSVDAIQWNAFIAGAKNATFLFHRNFMEYHADRFTDFSLIATNEKGRWLGVLPANIIEANRCIISHQGLTYGGLVTAKKENLLVTLAIFRAMLQFLHQSGIRELHYKALPAFYNSLPAEEYRYALFLAEAVLYRCDTTLAIHQASFSEIAAHNHRLLRIAVSKNLIFEESDDFASFWEQVLTPHLAERYGVSPVHNLSEITLLKGHFPSQIRQFNVIQDGKILAGMTFFETPCVAHAQYIASNEQGRNYNALKSLVAYLLLHVFPDKAVFDMGICNENNGLRINKGLLFWKEKRGGRTYTHEFFKVLTANFHLLEDVLS